MTYRVYRRHFNTDEMVEDAKYNIYISAANRIKNAIKGTKPHFNGKCFCICIYNFATAFAVRGSAQVSAPVNGGLFLAGDFLCVI